MKMKPELPLKEFYPCEKCQKDKGRTPKKARTYENCEHFENCKEYRAWLKGAWQVAAANARRKL